MILNKDKKYTFAGITYSFGDLLWDDGLGEDGFNWTEDEFQYFADAGLVTEAREPITDGFRVVLDKGSYSRGVDIRDLYEAIRDACGGARDAANKTFDVVFTEVL